MAFQASPCGPADFATMLKQVCRSKLASLLAGYVWNWNLTEDDAKFDIAGLAQTAKAYEQLGMSWLAAEVAGLAGKTSLKTAAKLAEKSGAIHAKLGTNSLVDAIRPAPIWERALTAIGQLGAGEPQSNVSTPQSVERLIWEITYSPEFSTIDLRPFLQKQKGAGCGSPV